MKAITISAEAGDSAVPVPQSNQPTPSERKSEPQPAPGGPVPEPGNGEANLAQQQAQALKIAEPVINGLGLSLKFFQDEETGRNIIEVYDSQSGEVIRQIPPKDVLAFLRRFDPDQALQPGQLLSRTV